jgi:hypothetical protein
MNYILTQANGNNPAVPLTKEMIMSTFIPTTIIAIAILSGISAASARLNPSDYTGRPLSSYDLSDPQDLKSFWDAQQRNGN